MPARIAAYAHDAHYNALANDLRRTVASRRDRAFIAMLTRWHAEVAKRSLTYVEVGVKQALFTREVLLACPFVERAYCIDRWKEYPADHPDREKFGYARRPQESWEELYGKAKKVLEPFGERAEIIRGSSLAVAATWQLWPHRHAFDVVMIDAGHTFEDVTADCKAWWGLLKSGGLLTADDWFPVGDPGREKTGVSRALELFAAERCLPWFGLHRTFYLEKP